MSKEIIQFTRDNLIKSKKDQDFGSKQVSTPHSNTRKIQSKILPQDTSLSSSFTFPYLYSYLSDSFLTKKAQQILEYSSNFKTQGGYSKSLGSDQNYNQDKNKLHYLQHLDSGDQFYHQSDINYQMYYSEFPYLQPYYYFNNYIPRYGYNTTFTHPAAAAASSCQMGIPKQTQRKIKEASQLSIVGGGSPTLFNAQNQQGGGQIQTEKQESNKDTYFHKQQIVAWLKSLPLDQRFEIFMMREKWFPQTIIQMFWKQKIGGDSEFALYSEEEKKEKATNKIIELDQQFLCRKYIDHDIGSNILKKEAEQELLKALRLIDDKEMYDSLVFESKFLEDVDRFVELFDLISDNNAFSTTHFQQWSWFNQNSFQTIAAWIVNQFERIINFRFLEHKHRFNNKQNKSISEITSPTDQQQGSLPELQNGGFGDCLEQ